MRRIEARNCMPPHTSKMQVCLALGGLKVCFAAHPRGLNSALGRKRRGQTCEKSNIVRQGVCYSGREKSEGAARSFPSHVT